MAAADRATNVQGHRYVCPTCGDFDTSDVLFVINSLIEQNSDLMGRLRYIDDFMKLAEGAALEAAQRLEAAKEESNRIIAEAREKAELQAATALRQAKEEAQAVLRSAREEAERVKRAAEEEAARIRAVARGRAAHEAMLTKLEAASHAEQLKAVPRAGSTGVDSKIITVEQQTPYSGVVDVEITPPVPLRPLEEVIKLLKRAENIRVLSLDGTVKRGLRLRLSVERPAPLIKILASLPAVESVTAQPRTKSSHALIAPRSNDHKVISLKIGGQTHNWANQRR